MAGYLQVIEAAGEARRFCFTAAPGRAQRVFCQGPALVTCRKPMPLSIVAATPLRAPEAQLSITGLVLSSFPARPAISSRGILTLPGLLPAEVAVRVHVDRHTYEREHDSPQFDDTAYED